MEHVSRIVLVTPRIGGADGVSSVTRQYLRVIEAWAVSDDRRVEVWSLAGEARPSMMAPSSLFFAAGSRIAFAARALRATGIDDRALVIATHVHLLPALLTLQYRGARVVTVLHGIEAWKPMRPLERLAMRRAWRVVSVSAHTAERFRRANPQLAMPIRVCHSSVEDARTATAAPRRASSPYALIVGRMMVDERYKGHDLLLEIWPRVQQAVPDAQLVIVGDGDDRTRLTGKTATLGLSQSVIFTGRIADDDLGALYRDAAMFVMPSRDEG